MSKRERVELNRIRADAIRANFIKLENQMKICIDCSFSHIMNETERRSLAVQIQETYSHLRIFGSSTCQVFVSSVDEWLRSTLSKKGSDQWALRVDSEPVERIAQSLGYDLILLSPDATEELKIEEINDTRNFFVIGGIVDRVVSRNETAHKAIRLGVSSRRIPTSEGIVRNRIFNIDSVAMFLMRAFRNEAIASKDGLLTLLEQVLPNRKRGALDNVPKKERLKICDDDVGNVIKLDRYSVVDLFR
jgi:hypothetical protein